MANVFRLKRSSVAAKVPTTGDLQLGELALNTFDGKLYTLRNNGTASVVEIGAPAAGSIVDATISATAEIAVSKLADGAARQLLQTDAAGTGVEWTDNVDIPGTLDVTGNATFDANVGVGTTSPTSKLAVGGAAPALSLTHSFPATNTVGAVISSVRFGDADPGREASATISAHIDSIWAAGNAATALRFNTSPAGSVTAVPRLTIDSTGRVGIGTTGPGTDLDVSGSGTRSIRAVTTDTSGVNIGRLMANYTGGGGGTASNVELRAGDGYTYLVNTTNTPLLIGTNLAERVRVTSAGNVGIGTSAPGSTLDVKGTLRLSGATSGYVGFAPAAAAGSTTYTLPSADGTNGQFLSTNGTGTLSWGAAAVADGDKGDITVSGSGATWTIDNGAVTSAKMSATGVIADTVGSTTAIPIVTVDAQGRITDLSNTVGPFYAASNLSGGSTGSIPYQTSTGLALTTQLDIGTAGQALVVNSGATAPQWTTLTMENIPDAAFKRSVRVGTTANITLSGTQTIDGIAVVAGNRVLVKNQTTQSANGIYVVAAGAWTRALDADTASEIGGATVNVDSGTVNGGHIFSTSFKTTDTLGTTAMTWGQIIDTLSSGLVTSAMIEDGTIVNGDISASAGIVDTKLATISTAGKVSGSAITSGTIGGSTVINTSGAITTSAAITDVAGDVRDIPQNSRTSAYTLVISDAGKHISITTGGVTVPSAVFSAGDTISVFNNSASNQTITQGASVTMYLAGSATTGNRTLAQRGICTVLCVASNTFVISGAGLT